MTGLIPLDKFVTKYCSAPGKFLDVGGWGMCFPTTLISLGHQYETLNIGRGDFDVEEDPYHWQMIPGNTYDYVISITAFEHIEFPWMTFLEMVRVVKTNGLIYILAPSTGGYHENPVDCWRFFPDAMRAFAKWGKVTLLETGIPTPDAWSLCEGIFKKETA